MNRLRRPGRWLLVPLLVLSVQTAEAASRGAVIDRVVPAVVAIRVTATRPFDTERAGVSNATGFVVDAARGLILTNRHVVRSGPVTAEAVFLNHEKVDLVPVYRDPVHDFGFYRFDPADVRFMELREIPLDPQGAQVGLEVLVIGNDAGEKLAILDGTLARLDRDAPRYGRGRYNDFNTFYLQAASGTSGGSSGSPVVDRRGRAVALNAGSNRRSASSFFLPLDRVVRALDHLRRGEAVPRGTLQAVFAYEPFDELRRLGLRPETEAALRAASPDAVGRLVVREVLPEGPAADRLEPGDVLLGIDGRPVADFAALGAALDDAVGRERVLEIERRGEPRTVPVTVGDLHAVTPDRYLEMGGGILHPLSYQQARGYGAAVGGVTVASPGYALRRAGVPARAVLTHVDGEPVPDLETLESRLAALPDRARVPVRWHSLTERRVPRVAVLEMDRHWFPMRLCRRDDATGSWPCRAAPPPPAAPQPEPVAVELAGAGPRPARALAPSLVFVEFDIPYAIDGARGSSFSGAGLVVDAEAGLVVVDRDTVPISLGDVTLTFARSLRVPGRVVALHPEHNLAFVGYDPARLAGSPVRSARLSPGRLEPGRDLWLVGLTVSQQPVARRTQVVRFEPASLPLPSPPRFRESNLELAIVTEKPTTVGGVLADRKGRVLALWASFSADAGGKPRAFFSGIPIELVTELLPSLRAGGPLVWRSLGAELEAISIADARARGLADADAAELASRNPRRAQALAVRRIAADTVAVGRLEPGDLLLAANGEPVTRFREVEVAARQPEVALRVLRDGRPLELVVPTTSVEGGDTDRLVIFGGALLQRPPRAVSVQRGVAREGVYVAGRWRGSPAERHRLSTARRIVAVDGRPTPDLDALLAAVAGVGDRGSLQLRLENLEGKPEVRTLELDLRYWPTAELRRDRDGRWSPFSLSR